MRVPFNDPVREVRALGGAVEEAVASVVGSGFYVMGPQHDAFEREFADYCGIEHCMGVANGTDALEIALRAVDCGPGDEVVTVANAGMYAAASCVAVGAIPVFADVEAETLELSPRSLEAVLSSQTRAIVVTHLYGKLADVTSVLEIARGRNIAVIEDCAQAHGARRDGTVAGGFGDIAAFSFYPTKNLGALGDAGLLATNDSGLAGRVRHLRQYGWDSKYHAVDRGGRNSRLDEMQAAVLRVKLPRLDEWNERRSAIVSRYREAAQGTELRLVHEPASDFVAHLCVGLHPARDQFRERLANSGVDTAVHFPTPDHLQPALASVPWRAEALDVTERAADQLVSLPCYPGLTDDEVDWICDTLA